MSAAIITFPLRPASSEPELPLESFDVQELAAQAAEELEAYRRAPWTKLSDERRLSRLRRAKELLDRIDGLETGRIGMQVWGD